jgi:DNA-binding transcriptional ArsR family regulator
MKEQAIHISETLKLIANPYRLLLLCELAEGALTVGELCRIVPDITQSAVSQHLGILKASGILAAHKDGLNVSYSILDTRIVKIIDAVKDCYCR